MARVMDSWRTVRFFLSSVEGDDGVFEVQFDHTGTTRALRCDCSVFGSKGGCAHVTWVRTNDFTDDGRLRVKPGMSAISDQGSWRSDVLSNVRVEVV